MMADIYTTIVGAFPSHENLQTFVYLAICWFILVRACRWSLGFYRKHVGKVLGGRLGRFLGRHRELPDRFDELAKRLDDLEDGFDDLEDGFERLDKRVRRRFVALKQLIKQALGESGPLTVASSPVKLTDYGTQVAKQISAAEWAEAEARGRAGDVTWSDDFEVYEFAVRTAWELWDDREPLSEHTYKLRKAVYEAGLEADDVRDLLAVMLRDALLAVREAGAPGGKQAE